MADAITHYITAKRFLGAHPEKSDEFARGLYFGSQGPDLFFFGATKRSHALAEALHAGDPSALFRGLADDIRHEGDLYRGYALGVLLHYFGDRGIHPYVGWYCRKNPTPYVHNFLESAIDMCVYEREYGARIAGFDYDAAFRYDHRLLRAVEAFWNRRMSEKLSPAYLWCCLRQMNGMTKVFLRARPFTVKLALLLGRLTGNTAAAMAHFKRGADESVMNDAHDAWLSPAGVSHESVEDILERAVAEFTAMYDALAAGTYRFDFTETFSYGL